MVLFLLDKCAACSKDLAFNAPRCVRCWVRYCDSTCQHDHWRRGHKQMCKKIHRGGNAEHYHANKKYKEALAVAVEACAEDAKGQTCYICLEAVHPSTGEGLVRGCACEGNQGWVHVSCLVRQNEIELGETKDQSLALNSELAQGNTKGLRKIIDRILSCKLCKKQHDPIILRAIGWGCWKQCASKSESRLREDFPQVSGGLTNLGICLYESGHTAEAIQVEQAAYKLGGPLTFK